LKIYKYAPHDLEDAEGNPVSIPFKGEIEVEMMTYQERLGTAKAIGLVDDDNALDKSDEIIALVAKRVKSVDVKAGDIEIKSLDELGYYKEGSDIINDIGRLVMQGIPLGNP